MVHQYFYILGTSRHFPKKHWLRLNSKSEKGLSIVLSLIFKSVLSEDSLNQQKCLFQAVLLIQQLFPYSTIDCIFFINTFQVKVSTLVV